MKTNKTAVLVVCIGLIMGPAQFASAHCQIPCGIYGDATRFTILEEHITTIEKAINQIGELSKEGEKNANQLVRWIVNKDSHADAFAEVVTQYFLQQRIKPGSDESGAHDAAYVEKVTLCHKMLVTVMKTKQTTDLEHVERLRGLLSQFREAYFSEQDEKHMGEHHHEGSAKEGSAKR